MTWRFGPHPYGLPPPGPEESDQIRTCPAKRAFRLGQERAGRA